MNNYCVYMHITPNNKRYVGITGQSPKLRWKNGYGYASSPHFYNAILKYGWDNIEHIILATDLSLSDACNMEKELIAKYDLTNREKGYNECAGGEWTNGYHISEERRNQLKSQIISDEQRKKISNTVKRRWKEGAYENSNHNKNKVAWNKGLTKDDPRIAKYVHKKGEFHHSEATKKKLSLTHKGKPAHNRRKIVCVETGVVYNSISEARQLTGITTIACALSRGTNKAGKLHWRYLNDNL